VTHLSHLNSQRGIGHDSTVPLGSQSYHFKQFSVLSKADCKNKTNAITFPKVFQKEMNEAHL